MYGSAVGKCLCLLYHLLEECPEDRNVRLIRQT